MNFYMDDILVDMQKAVEEVMLKNNKTFEDAQARLDALYSKIEDNRAEIAPLLEEDIPAKSESEPAQPTQYIPEEEEYKDDIPEEDDDF